MLKASHPQSKSRDIFLILLLQVDEDLLSTKAVLEKAQSIAANAETRAEAASRQVKLSTFKLTLIPIKLFERSCFEMLVYFYPLGR